MENWNDSDFKLPKSSIPKDVFEDVKKRLITRRVEAQKNHRQMVVGSALLLILGTLNIGILLSTLTDSPKTTAQQAEMLNKAYFETGKNVFDEQ